MKKLVYSGLMLASMGMAFTSCNKEIENGKVQQQVKQEEAASAKPIRFLNAAGQEISKADANMDLDNAVLIVSEEKSGISARYFTSETEAYAYVCSQSKFSKIQKTMEIAKEIRELAIQTGDLSVENPADYSAEMKQLLSSYPAEQTKGVGLLFDNLNASGSIAPLTGSPQPTLFGFNNKAESASGAGLANNIWDKKFFSGSSIYLLLGTGSVINFDGLGFQNRAESAI